MRKTFRKHGGIRPYWEKRWTQIPADGGVLNLNKYPGKYAEAVMSRIDGEALEAGCGAGRVLLHYHRGGRRIIGMDFIETAIAKIKRLDAGVPVSVADIMKLPYRSGHFSAVLAFGLYHNLERDIEAALQETRRVLSKNGWLVASVRMDNIENRINDWMAARGTKPSERTDFHKSNFTEREFRAMLKAAGFSTERIEYVENMPILYKFAFFRHATHKVFDEHRARGEGYRLSDLGAFLQRLMISVSPGSFCNIMVATARAA